MRQLSRLAVIVAVLGSSPQCGRHHSTVVVNGTPLLEALCTAWTRCAAELGPLGSASDCVAALGHCSPVAFTNNSAELDACVAAVEQATCYDLAETPFHDETVVDSFNDGRRGGELLLAWLQRHFATCGNLWPARPADAPGLGGDCGALPCADVHTYCDRESILCAPQGRAGDPCAGAAEANRDCQQGLQCEPTTNRCGEWPLAGPGEDCDSHLACNTALCADRRGSVKCRLKVERGGWCDRDQVCYGHRVCRANTCVDRGTAGAACDETNDCQLGFACRELGGVRQCQTSAVCG